MTKEEYEGLLKSDYWKGFSYSLIKERNFTCEDCGRSFYNQRNKLQVHHLVYRDINPWSYKPEEMVVLCEECHKRRHGIITTPEAYANTTYNHNANGDYTKTYSYSSESKKEGALHTDTFGDTEWTGGNRNYYSNYSNFSNQKIPTVLKLFFLIPFCFFVLIFGFGIYLLVKPDDRSISHDSRFTHSFTQKENDYGGYTEKEVQEIVNGSWDKETPDIEDEATEKVEVEKKDPVKKQAQRDEQIEDEPKTELSTSELLERQSHNMMVREAKRMGVSTEGSTSEIMDRISHANMVREAKRMGVSTEGTTSEIMDRISHANMVREAKRLGVSTEGTTSEIMERITRKQMENLNW